MENEKYAGGVSLLTLSEKLSRIAPRCAECACPMTDICIEKCCAAHPIFCRDCDTDFHFLHRTNDMRVLFLAR